MSEGNWRLTGWWLPEDNFLTINVLLYAILVKCLGFTPRIMFYLSAILWSGVAVVSLVLAQAKWLGRDKIVAMAAVTTPILLPIIRNNGAMDKIAHDWAHSGTILYVLVSLLLAKKAIAGRCAHVRLILLAYTLVMVLAVFGDSFAIFIGAIPVMAVSLFCTFQARGNRVHGQVLILTLLAVILGKVLVAANSRLGGFELLPLHMQFVPFSDFGNNIAWTLHYFFQLFGCDFFGKDLLAFSIDGPALSLIRLPFLALLIASLLLIGRRLFAGSNTEDRRWPAHEDDYLDALLATALTINVLSAVFSTQIVDAASIRFFFPTLVFGGILVARTQIRSRWLGVYYCVALSASLLFSFTAYAQNPRQAAVTSKEIKAVTNWLSKNNLTDGFGPYWSSSIITAATQNRIRIRALIADTERGLKPFEWEANKKWYSIPTTSASGTVFVLVNNGEAYFYSEAHVLRTLGEPLDKHELGPYIINVYDSSNQRLQSLFLLSTTAR
jgi:hypothetical protein